MSEINIRKATIKDVEFLTEVIVEAEKGGTDKFGFASMLNLSEQDARFFIKKMLEEEIEGCEFSISSFLIASVEKKKIAAAGGWIEGMNEDNISSSTIKANLFSHILPIDNIRYMHQYISVLKELHHERKHQTLQIEYVYVNPEYRGQHLSEKIISRHIEYAKSIYPGLNEVYVQLFNTNINAKAAYEYLGFLLNKVSNNIAYNDITKKFPGNIKLEMIKNIQ